MVCSACGFENASGMRSCGMCGMPLPHRPLTTPGAQSTLQFTRVPAESGAGSQAGSATPASPGSAAGVLDAPADNAILRGGSSDAAAPVAVDEAPPKELVPDVPLDEYIQSFHYQPPGDPSEVTMRGDAHVAQPESSVAPPAASAPQEVQAATTTSPVHLSAPAASETPVTDDAEKAAALDVDRRLGLEPEEAAEGRVERPRFLDINPPTDSAAETSETSTIVGPSFLGLSDAPQIAAEPPALEAEGAPRSHWRLWLAAAVVLLFVGLGLMEWRSQVAQNNSGPVAVIRSKIRTWRRNAASQPTEPAPVTTASSSNGSESQPEMQVQEPPKPQTQAQATNPGGQGSTNTNSGANVSANSSANSAVTPPAKPKPTAPSAAASAANSNPPAPQPQAAGNTASKKPVAPADQQAQAPAAAAEAAGNAKPSANVAAKPKATRASDDSGAADATAKAAVPGAEELAKAKNASDAAATAAWLWKSTAKGNPDAPVQLANMYILGDGVPRSCEQAVVLLKTAAEKENARARNRLASMYATGDCVQRNRVEAYRWMSSALAANPDSEWARQNREILWQQMTPDERAMAMRYR